ncbi:MAG TPA: heat-inducible transcriptional repressor HrcA [Anaerolineaceae bacterium]|jgi:heat-inducible transcriptional repressor|nr:heat-inducible transcriptional repressor HrcA [Anaerolineaceae bacterium]
MIAEQLTERQKFILTLVVHDFTRTATPVASQHLVERYHLDLSSATVRNEMMALTEQGFLRQPHTSAGRIPTEEGYRYFVGHLLRATELPDDERRTISHQFYQTRQDMGQWVRLAASVLAHQSRVASLVTAPHPAEIRFRHLELISTRGLQVLIVLVLMGGEVRQRLVSLDLVASQEQLSALADHLTTLFSGKDAAALRSLAGQLSGLEMQIAAWLIEDMSDIQAAPTGEVFLDGVSNVLAEPEFIGSEDARRALQLLEERSLLQDLLARSVLTDRTGGVQILIGGEGAREELRPFSMVLASYGAPGLAMGTLGVLGPMRMSYGRSISTVRFLSSLLSNLVAETLAENGSDDLEEEKG